MMVKPQRHLRQTCARRAPLVCALLIAVWFVPQAAQAQTAPLLISEATSTRAIALDSLTWQREPFSPVSTNALYRNQLTCVQLFALSLTLAPDETASAVTAEAEDGAHRVYPLTIEQIAPVPGQPWLSSITIRLSRELESADGDVLVGIRYRNASSNRVRLAINRLGGGPLDDRDAIPTPGTPPGSPPGSLSNPPSGDSLHINSPTPGATVRGAVTFRVQFGSLAGVSSVEYLLNGRPLTGPLTRAPFEHEWHSASVWDGPATVQALARDERGALLAQTPATAFTIANGPGTIRLVSPDASQTLRGTVRWEVEANYPITADDEARQRAAGVYPKPIEGLLFFVDGQLVHQVYGFGKYAIQLDTTRFGNGTHELFVAAYANTGNLPPAAMLQVPVVFDNGHAARDVRPRWREMLLAPGETASLGLRTLYTDSDVKSFDGAATYTSDNPSVAIVNGAGVVTATGTGVAIVSIEADGFSSTSRVVVDAAHNVPHFGRDGQILNAYDPANSLFVRSLFFLNADELANPYAPGLPEQIQAAKINTLTTGFFLNPTWGGATSFDVWRTSYDDWWNNIERVTKQHELKLIITGDDMGRTSQELATSIGVTNPWGPDALRHALTRVRDSKLAVSIEGIDETNAMWGATPKPSDGRWLARTPSLPDDSFKRLMTIINSVPDRPRLTWPVVGLSGLPDVQNWMGDPEFSDYTSHFWTFMDWRRAYPYGASLWQERSALERVVTGRATVVQRGKPTLLLTSLTGPYYVKGSDAPSTEYTPGTDQRLEGETRPASVAAEIMYAAATGMAGVRGYGFDGMLSRERAGATKGGYLQTGASPFTAGSDRWHAMAAAFNLIQKFEPMLLGTQISAVDIGPSIVTGARQNTEGRLLIAVNFNEKAERATINLQPYLYAGAAAIARYRLVGGSLRTDAVANKPTDEAVFQPGETIIWHFIPASGAGKLPPEVALVSPLQGAAVGGNVTIRATARDDVKVSRVEFLVDGRLHSTVNSGAGSYTFMWDSGGAQKNIWHGITVRAYDDAGNVSEARQVVLVR